MRGKNRWNKSYYFCRRSSNTYSGRKHLFRAAAVGMFDPLQGATENVIVGGVPPVGTGVVRLGFMKRFKVEEIG